MRDFRESNVDSVFLHVQDRQLKQLYEHGTVLELYTDLPAHQALCTILQLNLKCSYWSSAPRLIISLLDNAVHDVVV